MDTSTAPSPRFLDPTFGHAFRIWWAWFWRTVVFAVIALVVLHVVRLGLSILLGGSEVATYLVSFVLSLAAVLAGQIYTLWHILDKDFRNFRLRIEEDRGPEISPPTQDFVAPTLNHALKVWWAWFWRQFLWSLAAGIPIGFIIGFFGAMVGLPEERIRYLGAALGSIVSIFVGVHVLRRILQKNFGMFRLRLLPT